MLMAATLRYSLEFMLNDGLNADTEFTLPSRSGRLVAVSGALCSVPLGKTKESTVPTGGQTGGQRLRQRWVKWV
jgi:hypothetical protein